MKRQYLIFLLIFLASSAGCASVGKGPREAVGEKFLEECLQKGREHEDKEDLLFLKGVIENGVSLPLNFPGGMDM